MIPNATTPKTIETLDMAELGNQLLAPLLAGLRINNDSTGNRGDIFNGKFGYPSATVPLGANHAISDSFSEAGTLHYKRKLASPPGSIRRLLQSLGVVAASTHRPKPEPDLSPLANVVVEIHQQLIASAINTGECIDKDALPKTIRYNMLAFRAPSSGQPEAGHFMPSYTREYTPSTNQEYPKKLAQQLTTQALPRIPLKLSINGKPFRVSIPNVTVPQAKGQSLAHTMFALGMTGELVQARRYRAEWKDFILQALPIEATYKLPPIQAAVYKQLVKSLNNRGYSQPEPILRDSGCDIDRAKLRQTLENLLPFADIYETACHMRGSENSDRFLKALQKVKHYTGKTAAQPLCRDGYECAILVEGIIDQGIARASIQDKNSLIQLKETFVTEFRSLLGRKDPKGMPFPSLVNDVMALPSAARIIKDMGDSIFVKYGQAPSGNAR